VIPFNRPTFASNETAYLLHALEQGVSSTGEKFSLRCRRWLSNECGAEHVHLVQSATVGLELAALICDLGPGDEVILPSFTFVGCANSVALRGATPVFADIEPEALNLDPAAVEAAITARTRAILAVHYGGVPCDMNALRAIADRHGLFLIEDAAQALLSRYHGRAAGSLGDIGVFSFHHTKNVTCGEGGAIIVNAPRLADRAEILHQHGTDLASFQRQQVDRYTWLDLGSSYVPSEITAAVLLAQLEQAHQVTLQRQAIWDKYQIAFADIESSGRARRPMTPLNVTHNGHIYYLLAETQDTRDALIRDLRTQGITAAFHYVPLHNSPGGLRYGRAHGTLQVTESMASRIVRLPIWPGMASDQDRIITAVTDALIYQS